MKQTIELMEINEVADFFRVSIKTIRNWIKRGELKAQKPGRKYLFKREDVDAYFNRVQEDFKK